MRKAKGSSDAGEAFVSVDRGYDLATTGSLWLNNPQIAQVVVEALQYGEADLGLYELIAWVIMANHVHALLRPKADLARITKTIKGFTARRANAILDRTGKPFWQDESYDRWVRDDDEFMRIIHYIERNPVKAGLVAKSEDWPWSSAGPTGRTGRNACAT